MRTLATGRDQLARRSLRRALARHCRRRRYRHPRRPLVDDRWARTSPATSWPPRPRRASWPGTWTPPTPPARRRSSPPARRRGPGCSARSTPPSCPPPTTSSPRCVQLHAATRPPEHADIERFVRQWLAVRDLLSPTSVASRPAATLATALAAAYPPLGAHLDRLFLLEQAQRAEPTRRARPRTRTRTTVARHRRSRWPAIRSAFSCCARRPAHPPDAGAGPGPGRIRRHAADRERRGRGAPALAAPSGADPRARPLAVVLNSNNSADRLEAVMPLPDRLAARGRPCAGPSPAPAWRCGPAGRTARAAAGRPCSRARSAAPCPGASSCVPLVVGGEVIGSVLLIRPAALRLGGRAADPRVRQPGRAGARQPAQPGDRGVPRRPPTASPACPTSGR